MTPLQSLLDRLDGVTSSGGSFQARCPAHDDRVQSLSLTDTDEGKVLLKCMAGCPTEAVLEALELTWAALFPKGSSPQDWGDPESVYTYENALGVPTFQVVRFPGKIIRPRKMNGQYGLAGVKRLIYRLPQVLAEAARGGEIWVPEGEKDVHALEAAGVVATCNPLGAGKWEERYTHAFRGARRVVVVADFGAEGFKHAAYVAMCASVVTKVLVVRAKVGKDAADHLGAGYGLDDFIPVLCSCETA